MTNRESNPEDSAVPAISTRRAKRSVAATPGKLKLGI
jgi:hypothetical protein